MNTTLLVFDFFGVICSEIAPFWLPRHFSPSQAVEVKSTLVHKADLGEITQAEMFQALSALTNISPETIESEWLELVRIDDAMVALVEELRTRYRVALLTNAPSAFVREILLQHNLSTLFEATVVSSEVGYAKPDRRIYEHLLTHVGVSPGEALMIDDNPVNIAGAQSIGMSGRTFTSYEDLRSFWHVFGVRP